MLIHQVYFWLNDPQSIDDRDQLKKGLESLLTIETIKSGYIGIPASTPPREVVDHSFAFSYQTTFENMNDHEVYQNHIVHLRFVEDCEHLWDRVQVYDYSLTD